MRARFVGDPNDNFSGPERLVCWDVEFEKGKWREVEDERFARHSHFETEGAAKPAAVKPKAEPKPKGRGKAAAKPAAPEVVNKEEGAL